MIPRVPHLAIVVAFCVVAVGGYALFSFWAISFSGDKAMIGDIGGTWKTWAALAFGFWLGSSSGGKSRDAASIPPPSEPTPPENEERIP